MNFKEIYTDVFTRIPEYNLDESGWIKAGMALQYVLERPEIQYVMDVGCGRGRFLNILKKSCPHIITTGADLDKFGDYTVDHFHPVDLSIRTDIQDLRMESADLLVCTGVLEHVPEEAIDLILEVFSQVAPKAFISIGNHEEVVGGHNLHLIIKGRHYWDKMINQYFTINRCVDNLYDNTLFIYELTRK